MAFRAPIKVHFADIDNTGIVYYPRFLHYFHLAMVEFFTTVLGIDHADVLHKHKVSFPVVHLACDFRGRIKYGDRIDMEVRVLHAGKTSIKWGYRGFRTGAENDIVVEGHTITVCVQTETFEKVDIPEWLRQGLNDYMERVDED